jgi:Prokaryotic N-terminal methylation motif
LKFPNQKCRGVTLVEAMFSLLIMAMFMLGFLGAFVQSRRVTESSVLHAAATSMVYGIIEQIKELDYATLLPNHAVDPSAPTGTNPASPTGEAYASAPYVRVRINQSTIFWLGVVHTPASTAANPTTPQGPTTTPAPGITPTGAINNQIGNIPLSSVTGTMSQQINLNIWVWVDDIPDPTNDVTQMKKVTVIYTYSYRDGGSTKTVCDREVFLRSRYDQ